MINTIVVRGFTSCGLDVPSWIGSTTGFMGSNKFGQVFLSKSYLIDRVSFEPSNFVALLSKEIPPLLLIVLDSNFISFNIAAKFVFLEVFTYLLEMFIVQQPLHSENSEETVDVNVTEPQISTVTIKPPTNTWVLFAKFIDRLLFIIVFALYIFMYFLLMPKGYTFGQPRGDIEIIGL